MMVLKGLVSPVVTIPAHQHLHVLGHDGVVPVPDFTRNMAEMHKNTEQEIEVLPEEVPWDITRKSPLGPARPPPFISPSPG